MTQRGFTLVEMMVAVTILLILLFSGMPALGSFTGNISLRVASEALRDGMAVARNEAIRRNTTVQFRFDTAEWTVVLPGSGGTDDTVLVRRAAPTDSTLRTDPAEGMVAFGGNGRTFPAGTALAVQYSNPAAGTCRADGGEITCLRVELPVSGEPRLCDPAAVPGNPTAC